MFSLDLSSFVSDPEGAPVTLSVVAGGGTFNGATYQNTFDSIGTYTVTFAADDGVRTTLGTFVVVVETANLAVVQVDSANLRLLDTDTEQFLLFSETANTETFRASLPKGTLIFEQDRGSHSDLHAYDPASRSSFELGADGVLDELFEALTLDGRVLFTKGTTGDRDLLLWDPASAVSSPVSALGGRDESNAHVDGSGLVFFDSVYVGKGDIYYFDPVTGQTVDVSIDPADERMIAALPGGGAVFRRTGSVAEYDLFYFSASTGIVEVGIDVVAIEQMDKSFNAVTSDGRLVFSATDNTVVPADVNIYLWEPAGGNSTLISSTTTTEANTFGAITADDIVAYTATDAVGNDVFAYTVGTGALVQINAAAVVHQFEAVATRAAESAVVYTVPAAGSIHVYNVATATLYNDAAQTYVFDAVTSDGRVIYSQTNAGGGMFSYDHVANATQTVVSGTGVPTFRSEGAAPGDVVFSVDVGGQDDLFLWVDAATALMTVSDVGVDETFQSVNPNGKVLYTRVVGSNTNQDLFIFDPIDMSRTRLTQQDPIGNMHDHAVVASYHADQS